MIYAIECKAIENAPTTMNGKLENTVRRFEDEQTFQSALDRIYTGRDGLNLVKVDYQFVFGHLGYNIVWTTEGVAYDPHNFLRLLEEGDYDMSDIADEKSRENLNTVIRAMAA